MLGPGFGRYIIKKVRPPIPLHPRREHSIEHCLNGRIRHGTHMFEQWGPGANFFKNLIDFIRIPQVAPNNATELLVVEMFRERWTADGQGGNNTVELLRSLMDEAIKPLHNFFGSFNGP